jgi:hypothetical protein
MSDMKYPIGTKVIYNPPYTLFFSDEKYRNKVGIIIVDSPIFPQCRFPDGKQVATSWRSLTPIKVKGQQLLFSFME